MNRIPQSPRARNNRSVMTRWSAIGLIALMMSPPGGSRAQDAEGEEETSHPAEAVVESYLAAVVGQDWEEAAKHVALDSLLRRQRQFIEAVQASPTIDIERARLEGLGVRRLEDLRALEPREFYQREREATHRQLNVTPATLERKSETLEVNFIAVVDEGDDTAHALVRTTQETLDSSIEEMLVLTLERQDGDEWAVVPDAQRPLIRPLDVEPEIETEAEPDEEADAES